MASQFGHLFVNIDLCQTNCAICFGLLHQLAIFHCIDLCPRHSFQFCKKWMNDFWPNSKLIFLPYGKSPSGMNNSANFSNNSVTMSSILLFGWMAYSPSCAPWPKCNLQMEGIDYENLEIIGLIEIMFFEHFLGIFWPFLLVFFRGKF